MTEENPTSTTQDHSGEQAAGVLDRQRSPRPPLVPRWLLVGAGVGVAALLILGGGLLYAASVSKVTAPKIVGLELGVARNRVAGDRLEVTVSERRFSGSPLDTILEQSPAPGTAMRRGDDISVVISAGTEEFSLPDVIGDGLLLARGKLEEMGLQIRVETEPSEAASETVLATNPSPGSKVRTGEVVRITVASAGPSAAVLVPSSFKGVVVTLDPSPVPVGQSDVVLEIARRLRSLIEASGGTVVMTRSLTDTGTASAEPARLRRAKAGSATVAVGLDVNTKAPGGITALYPIDPESTVFGPSRVFASQIATSLVNGGLAAKSSASTTDAVLAGTGAPWSRVRLGSLVAPEDVSNFRDPRWADSVARGIYRALAKIYGTKAPL